MATYNFSSGLSYYEDLSQIKALGMETAIQSIWIDNSQNAEPVTVVINGSFQQIVVPAQWQGIFPAFFSDNAGFWISTAQYQPGQQCLTRICLLNVPCGSAGMWNTQSQSTPLNGSGVSISQILGTQYFNLSNIITTSNVIIPPVSEKRWFLSSILLQLGGNTTQSVAGEINISIVDSNGPSTIFNTSVYVPSVSPVTEYPVTLINQTNLNLIGGGTSNDSGNGTSLNLILSGALLGAGVSVTITGGYTTYTP